MMRCLAGSVGAWGQTWFLVFRDGTGSGKKPETKSDLRGMRRKAGQPAEAEACWRRILTLKRPDQFCRKTIGVGSIFGGNNSCREGKENRHQLSPMSPLSHL